MKQAWEPANETSLTRTAEPRQRALALASIVATSPWSEDTRKSRDQLLIWSALTLLLSGAFISLSSISGVKLDIEQAGPVIAALITLYWLLAHLFRSVTDLQVHSFQGARETEEWIRTQQAIDERVAEIESRIWDMAHREAGRVVEGQITMGDAIEFKSSAGTQLKNERDELTALMSDMTRILTRAKAASRIRNAVDLVLPAAIGIGAIGVALYGFE